MKKRFLIRLSLGIAGATGLVLIGLYLLPEKGRPERIVDSGSRAKALPAMKKDDSHPLGQAAVYRPGSLPWINAKSGVFQQPLRSSRTLQRLQSLGNNSLQTAKTSDGRTYERLLVQTSERYPNVVVQREYRAGADRSGLPEREFAYVADHVLVRPDPAESAPNFKARARSLGFSEPQAVGKTGIYRVPLVPVKLEAVDHALSLLAKNKPVGSEVAEPDFLVFSDEVVEATLPYDSSNSERSIDPVTQDWASLPQGKKPAIYAVEMLQQQEKQTVSSLPPGSRVLQFESENAPDSFRPGVLLQNFWTRTVSSSSNSSVFIQNAYSAGYPNNGSNYARVLDADGGLDFFHKDGLPFNVHSIDLSEYSTVIYRSASITFTGTKADGSVVTQTFTTDGIIDGTGPQVDFQTFTFPSSFTNLVKLRAGNPPYMVDNLVVTLVGQETPLPPAPVAPVVYQVDWDDASIAPNSAPPVSGPYAISSISFGNPLVRTSFGTLTSKPLELRGNGQGPYGQIRFDLARKAAKYNFEFDLVKTIPGKRLTFFLDNDSGVTTLDFQATAISSWSSGANIGVSVAYDSTKANRIRLEMDLPSRRWKLYVNGVLGFDSPYTSPIPDISDVRFSLDDAAGEGGAAIDNFRVEAIASSSPPLVQPRIAVLPAQGLVFPSTAVGGEVSRTITLQNSGTQDLRVTSIVSSNAAFIPGSNTFPAIAPGGTYYHTIRFKPQTIGLVQGQLTINSNDPVSPSLRIPAEGLATGIPRIVLDPGLLDAQIVAGTQGSEAFTIRNAGSANLEWRFIRADGLLDNPPAPRTTNDSLFGQLWGLGTSENAGTNAVRAWRTTSGASVQVAIVDTGVDLDHPDLIANLLVNPREIPGNSLDDDGNGYIDDVNGWNFSGRNNNPDDQRGHGTHVAGTIAASGNNNLGVIGVAWSAKILPIQFLSASGVGYTSDGIEAIQYAKARGVQLINASWGGGGYSSLLRDAIDQFTQQCNGLFVAAAGNNGANSDVSPSYPAAYDLERIVSVAATNPDDTIASFSNYGRASVDVAAPGSSILSTYSGGGYAFASGTSMAAPHVTGSLALLYAKSPSLPAQDQKELLLDYVDYPPALSGQVLSGGRVNIWRSLERVMAPWLTPQSTTGSVPPGSSSLVKLGINASSLAPGEYQSSLAFQTNDPLNATIYLPIRLCVIHNNGFNQWTEQNFSENGLLHAETSVSNWAVDADPDNDGIPNLLEYLFGRSATQPESPNLVQVATESGGIPYARFEIRTNVTGLNWMVEWSSDLVAELWRTDGLVVEEISRNEATGKRILKASFKFGAPVPAKAFFRIRSIAVN